MHSFMSFSLPRQTPVLLASSRHHPSQVWIVDTWHSCQNWGGVCVPHLQSFIPTAGLHTRVWLAPVIGANDRHAADEGRAISVNKGFLARYPCGESLVKRATMFS